MTVDCPFHVFDITTLTLGQIGKSLFEGLELRWDRCGEVHRIPRNVLVDAFAIYRSEVGLAEAGHIPDIRKPMFLIRWEQTLPLVELNLGRSPLPRSGHADRQAGREDAVAH